MALSAYPKTPQSSPVAWEKGVTNCPGEFRHWERERGHEPRTCLLTPRIPATEQQCWTALTFLHREEMEHRGLIKNQLDIGRECKIKMGTHTEYQMERRKAGICSPKASSHSHSSYHWPDWHAGGWESRSVTELERKPGLPYLATVVPFLWITEVWKIN